MKARPAAAAAAAVATEAAAAPAPAAAAPAAAAAAGRWVGGRKNTNAATRQRLDKHEPGRWKKSAGSRKVLTLGLRNHDVEVHWHHQVERDRGQG